MVETKRIVVNVSKDLHQKAKLKSVKEGKSISDKIRETLKEWVADGDPPENKKP